MRLSDRSLHFFHVVSNVRPIVWIGLYVAVTPLFALIYWLLPEGQFRIPDATPMDYGSCLYYSIVTITTLGFGDYTPTHAWSQMVTACEVMTGLIVIGLFLNAVGSMKSEIDVASEVERQRMLHLHAEQDKLAKNTPIVIHHINAFLTACYYVTTPPDKREGGTPVYNPDFTFADMTGMFAPTPMTGRSAVSDLVATASRTSLFFDSLQNRVDITLWPALLEDFFSFVANEQMFAATDLLAAGANGPAEHADEIIVAMKENPDAIAEATTGYLGAVNALAEFIRRNASLAVAIESELSQLAVK